ncbi:MAG: hypothetical protein DRG11_03855 [Epsilonproteobacteria bacterium]|nr:MAG: hypothetical protein DRG11_03855 [Campylobacterota bacterium]
MNKYLLYTIFVLKFLLGLGFIIWTIYVTIGSDVGEDEDNSLLSTYHKVDDNFNNISKANNFLNTNYDIKLVFNNHTINGIDTKDMFYSQRVIQNRNTRKSILKMGSNSLKIDIKTKNGKPIDNFQANIVVTKTTNHLYDKALNLNSSETQIFHIQNKGAWNITGNITIGKTTGAFMIKTDAK